MNNKYEVDGDGGFNVRWIQLKYPCPHNNRIATTYIMPEVEELLQIQARWPTNRDFIPSRGRKLFYVFSPLCLESSFSGCKDKDRLKGEGPWSPQNRNRIHRVYWVSPKSRKVSLYYSLL
jgi:hypothetical protein